MLSRTKDVIIIVEDGLVETVHNCDDYVVLDYDVAFQSSESMMDELHVVYGEQGESAYDTWRTVTGDDFNNNWDNQVALDYVEQILRELNSTLPSHEEIQSFIRGLNS